MITKRFNSQNSKDVVQVIHFIKSHKSIFKLIQFDDLSENIKLLSQCLEYLKNNDIKWIIIKELTSDLNFPTNTMWFRNNKTNDINCHIEDFEKFYINNMKYFIKSDIVYVKDLNENIEDGGLKLLIKRKRKIKRLIQSKMK